MSFFMMKRGLKSTPRHPIEITLANFVHLANSCDSMFSSPFFYACIPQFIIKWNNFRAYRRKILNRFERTDEKYRPSRRDVEKGTRISSPRGWYIYIFLVVSSRRVSLIWQWKESTVEKGGNMNNYARFGSIFFFFTLTRADHYICSDSKSMKILSDFGLWSSFFFCFSLCFLLTTPSITIHPFVWYLHKQYTKNTNRPIDQTTNHHRPNDQRGANRKIEKIKGSRKAGRSSKSLENNSTLALYLVQAAIWQCSLLVFFSVFSFFSCHFLFLSLSISISVSIAVSLPLSFSFLHSSFIFFFFSPLFLLIV